MTKTTSQTKLEKALRSAKASMEAEGFVLSADQEDLLRKKLNGDISEEEYKTQLKSL